MEVSASAWRVALKMMTGKLNDQLLRRKGRTNGRLERKGIQPASTVLRCGEPGCMFVGQTKADLVNHTRQGHGKYSKGPA